MSNHTYRVIEVVGTSPDGVDAAIRSGLARAAQTMRGLDWFEVESVRGDLVDGAVGHVQVTMKVGFRLEDSRAEQS
jgi:flavin-binding protein dodecin